MLLALTRWLHRLDRTTNRNMEEGNLLNIAADDAFAVEERDPTV